MNDTLILAGAVPAALLALVAAGDLCVMAHGVEADGDAVADGLVDVDRGALGEVGAERQGAAVEAFGAWGLADLVDRTAGRAAAGIGGGRPFQDLDLFQVERIAEIGAEVACAVDEHVAARIEAADERAIAGGDAALSGAEADAGHRAQYFRHGCGAALFDDGFRNDRNRARRVEQRLGEFRRGGGFGLVAVGGCLPLDGYGRQLHGRLRAALSLRRGCGRAGHHQGKG